jgi:hypothetical protein
LLKYRAEFDNLVVQADVPEEESISLCMKGLKTEIGDSRLVQYFSKPCLLSLQSCQKAAELAEAGSPKISSAVD